MDRLGILHHGPAVLSQLQFLDPLNITVPHIFILDLKGKGIQLIRQQFCQLCHLKPALIRPPDPPVIDIPDPTVTVKTGNRPEEISKGVSDSNLNPTIPGI